MYEPVWIKEGNEVYALHIPQGHLPTATEFVTPLDYKQQLGFIVYSAGKDIPPHSHKPLQRNIVGTSEVLILKKGKVEVHIFSNQRKLISKFIMNEGDILMLIAGGHGFKMIEDSIFLEIKQGPYTGLDEKERFNWSEQ
ncbi:MAG: WbuC family cupin fold metalloprotein [Bacteroidota bacterium]